MKQLPKGDKPSGGEDKYCLDCFVALARWCGFHQAERRLKQVPVLVNGVCPVCGSKRALGPDPDEQSASHKSLSDGPYE